MAKVGGHLLCGEGFEKIAFFQIAVVGDADAALHAVGDFARVVLEALERGDLAFVDLLAAAHHLDFRVAADDAVLYTAAGDGADLGNPEDGEDFGAAEVAFLERGFEQTHHGEAHLILQLVDDGVEADFDVLLLRQLGGLALGAHIEADDDGVRGSRQQHVALGDGADAGAYAP